MDFASAELPELLRLALGFVVRNGLRVWSFLTTSWASPGRAFWLPYIGAFFFWAWLAFRKSYGGRGFVGLLRFCFPKEVYLHRSMAVDVQVFLMNEFFRLPLRLLRGFGPAVVAATLLDLSWKDLRLHELDPWVSLLYFTAWMVLAELGYYWAHRLHHTVPFLWAFHKVHHSAEVLNPITTFRTHPVFDITSAVFAALLHGVLLAGLATAFGARFSPIHLFSANLYFILFQLFGKHLRHSHIWWAWGPRISHVFLSPAQHQIHHSCDPRHVNRNYGEMLAVWDWLFGSLYVAREKEDLQFGLGTEHGITNGVTAYLYPFVDAGRVLADGLRRRLVARTG